MVLVALIMIVILGFAALTIDLSRLFAYRNELQRSADAAALAGALELTKPTYGNAPAVVTTYANTNTIEGQTPTIDAIEYGTWDGVTFTATCDATTGGCNDPATVAAATAMRVTLSGGPLGPIFAQFLGQATSPNSIRVSAVAWAAPAAPQHDCIKPFAVRYSTLIAILDTVEGNAAFSPLDSARALTAVDIDTLRSVGPTLLQQCLTVHATDPCALPNTGTYQPAQIYPPTGGGGGTIASQIAASCATDATTVGPGDALDTASVTFGFDTAATYNAVENQWCPVYGPMDGAVPCLMKLALVQGTALPGTAATDGTTCGAVGAPTSCAVIRAILPYIVTNISPTNAEIQGYPTVAVDEAAVGTGDPPTALYRVVLVQ
jgi:Flp pilus assembly protein TadG